MTAPDPAALFRTLLGEWEKMANSVGGDMLRSEDWSRAMHGVQGAGLNAQAAGRETMERWLAAMNLPSRAEIEDLSARLGRMEDALARIEAHLGAAPARAARPRPARTRKPPEQG